MFTSSGFFRNNPCPFLAEGACDRSHCHFKHVRPVQTASTNHLSGSDVAQEDDNRGSSAVLRLDIVKDAVAKVRNAMEKEQMDLSHHHGNYMPYDPSASETSPRGGAPAPAVHTKLPSTMPGRAGRLEYRPTPIAELKKRHAAGVDITEQEYDPTRPSTAIGGSLGYHPTPITDLDTSNDIRQEPTTVIVNKYTEAFKYQGTDMEYDPIMNYSAVPKQQKRKLLDISEQSSAQPVSKQRKVGQDQNALGSSQDNAKLREDVIADDVSNSEEIKHRISESDTVPEIGTLSNNEGVSDSDKVSETGLGLSSSTTQYTLMNDEDIRKDTTQLFESKSSTRKTGATGPVNKQGNDTNGSSRPDRGDIKKKKSSKHLKDAKVSKDQSENSDEKAAKHGNDLSVSSKTRTKEKDGKSKAVGDKKNSTRKNPTKEEQKESRQHSKVKTSKTENSSASKSSSKLKSTDKNSSKPSRREKVFDSEDSSSDNLPKGSEGEDSVIDLVSEDCSTDMSDREKKRKLKKAKHEEIGQNNTGSFVENERKRMKNLKHSISLTKGTATKLSETYHPEVVEKMDWIKTEKQKLNPSDSDEYLSKVNSTKVKKTYKVHSESKSTEDKVNKNQGHKHGKDSKHVKISSEGLKNSHKREKEKQEKGKEKSSSSSSSKKGASNDKHGKLVAHKSSQKKLTPKLESPYDLTFSDSESDTFVREKSGHSISKSALKKLKSRGDKDGKTKTTPGIKVSHADLFGDDSEDDVPMPTDSTSQDASSVDLTLTLTPCGG
ncbi:PREDICTED: dentin sialophosphoprotein-like [Branchiostoma belcheri]|uniref:Dentin sialophosphoprotein-like n=1 Tax=Branchiostoma belcheri TaxID=7741 RepID=A0A6P5ATA5_BRABE|nr:PREDICTED: dentin sialophosphoprotein-like [Branchiostoma belcheri]